MDEDFGCGSGRERVGVRVGIDYVDFRFCPGLGTMTSRPMGTSAVGNAGILADGY